MDYALTAGTVDVQYDDGQQRATAALVVCGELTFSSVVSEHVARISRIEPYEAGRLYKRELPCIAREGNAAAVLPFSSAKGSV